MIFRKITQKEYGVIYPYFSSIEAVQYDMSFFWMLGINGYYYTVINETLYIAKHKQYHGKTKEVLLCPPIKKGKGYDYDALKSFEVYGMAHRDIVSDPTGYKLESGSKRLGGDIVYSYTSKEVQQLHGKKWSKFRQAIKRYQEDNEYTFKRYELSDKRIPIGAIEQMLKVYRAARPKRRFHLKTYIKKLPINIKGSLMIVSVGSKVIGFSIMEQINENYFVCVDRKHINFITQSTSLINHYIHYLDIMYAMQQNEAITINIGNTGESETMLNAKLRLRNAHQQHVANKQPPQIKGEKNDIIWLQ